MTPPPTGERATPPGEASRRLRWLGGAWTSLAPDAAGWARGYAFVGETQCLEDGEILAHLLERRSRLEETVAAMNGCFAAVLDAAPAPVLVTDRYATIPLYLHRHRDGLFASWEPWSVVAALDAAPSIDEVAALDLLRTSYALGARTLIRGIETLLPARIATLEASGLRVARYWRYGYTPTPIDPDDAARRLADVFERVATRTAGAIAARGRRFGLTLSGGLDSRVLAATLGRAASEPPTALSYGAPGDPEVEVAGEVAAHLGMPHRIAEVSSHYLCEAFLERSVREVGATTRFTCGVGARHLDTSGVDVLIPGHTGDFISGGHLPVQTGMVGSPRQLRRYLEFTHFRYLGSEAALRQAVRVDPVAARWESLEETLADFDFRDDTLGLIDRWNVENRQRRMILMELRAYEGIGRWMLPFYDHELVDFFAALPHALRLGQRLYVETAQRRLFTGDAAALAHVRRVGGRRYFRDTGLPRRLALLQRLQPVSGWALGALFPLRDGLRAIRPKPAQRYGTDPFKRWFATDARTREYLIDRIDAADDGLVDAAGLRRLLEQDPEERVFTRLLPGVITVGECRVQARAAWDAGRRAKR